MVFAVVMVLIWTSCSTNTEMSTPGSSSSLTAVAQTSSQLASGTKLLALVAALLRVQHLEIPV